MWCGIFHSFFSWNIPSFLQLWNIPVIHHSYGIFLESFFNCEIFHPFIHYGTFQHFFICETFQLFFICGIFQPFISYGIFYSFFSSGKLTSTIHQPHSLTKYIIVQFPTFLRGDLRSGTGDSQTFLASLPGW